MPHALDFSAGSRDLQREADVVLGLDVFDLDGAMRLPGSGTARQAERIGRSGQRVIHISLDELIHRGGTTDFQALPAVDLPVLASTSTALPLLLEEVKRQLDSNARTRIDARRQRLADQQQQLRDRCQAAIQSQWDHPQITEVRLAAELWQAIKEEDFIFAYGRAHRVGLGIFDLPGPERALASGGGGAVGAGPGVALGAALALKNSGKVPVAWLGDGETLASLQALWTAAHYRIPSLWVINNNRSYFNDEDHQDKIARLRDRPVENRWIAQRMEQPEVDFGAIARTFGLHGEDPVKDARDLGPAFARAIETVKQGGFAIVNVWTENRQQG
jgi:acetolactate synthase-1/2/3 large subunit